MFGLFEPRSYCTYAQHRLTLTVLGKRGGPKALKEICFLRLPVAPLYSENKVIVV